MVRFFLSQYPQVFQSRLFACTAQIMQALAAAMTAAILLLTPSFWIALCTWKFMVRSAMLRITAASPAVLPSADSLRTSISRIDSRGLHE